MAKNPPGRQTAQRCHTKRAPNRKHPYALPACGMSEANSASAANHASRQDVGNHQRSAQVNRAATTASFRPPLKIPAPMTQQVSCHTPNGEQSHSTPTCGSTWPVRASGSFSCGKVATFARRVQCAKACGERRKLLPPFRVGATCGAHEVAQSAPIPVKRRECSRARSSNLPRPMAQMNVQLLPLCGLWWRRSRWIAPCRAGAEESSAQQSDTVPPALQGQRTRPALPSFHPKRFRPPVRPAPQPQDQGKIGRIDRGDGKRECSDRRVFLFRRSSGTLLTNFRWWWLVLGAIYFTIKMGFINFRASGHAIQVVRGKYSPADAGEVSHFQALSAAVGYCRSRQHRRRRDRRQPLRRSGSEQLDDPCGAARDVVQIRGMHTRAALP